MDYNVLIIEDNVDLSFGLKYSLEKENMKIETSETLKDANEKMLQNNYDLLLLDVMLPDGKGFDFCENLRKTSDMPVIFLTACDEEFDIVRGLDTGDDYITKPFKLSELTSRIKAVMRRYDKAKQSTINQNSQCIEGLMSGDIYLDIQKGRAYKNQNPIQLTPLEYRLVYILMVNANAVMAREQILSKLWDSCGEFVEDKTLTVNISRLRTKLETEPAEPEYIVTVRGMGYIWNKAIKKGALAYEN